MSVERHELLSDDVGAYLLGALSDQERQRFESHLQECLVCQDEVERLRPAADALPRSVFPVEPPASLKVSLMAAVQDDLRARGDAEAARPRPLAALRRRVAAIGGGLAGARPGVAWVAASMILVAGVISGASGLYALGELGSEPGGKTRTVAAKVDETRVPLGSGRLVVSGSGGGAVLHVHGLPDLEDQSVYQVWVKRGDEVISQSMFEVGEDGEGAGAVVDNLRDRDQVMVTREPAGGSKAPSEEPFLRARL